MFDLVSKAENSQEKNASDKFGQVKGTDYLRHQDQASQFLNKYVTKLGGKLAWYLKPDLFKSLSTMMSSWRP